MIHYLAVPCDPFGRETEVSEWSEWSENKLYKVGEIVYHRGEWYKIKIIN